MPHTNKVRPFLWSVVMYLWCWMCTLRLCSLIELEQLCSADRLRSAVYDHLNPSVKIQLFSYYLAFITYHLEWRVSLYAALGFKALFKSWTVILTVLSITAFNQKEYMMFLSSLSKYSNGTSFFTWLLNVLFKFYRELITFY